MKTLTRYLDVLLFAAGAALVVAAVALLMPWPFALGLTGITLIVIALVVPPWA